MFVCPPAPPPPEGPGGSYTDRGRTGETEKGRREERRKARETDGQKEAVDLQKYYWPRVNVAERRACT